MSNRISILFGIALVSILLLAGPPALGQEQGVSACSNAWGDSSTSGSCDSPTLEWLTNLLCVNCCRVATKCETGNWDYSTPGSIVPEKKTTSIQASMDDVERLVNCSGNLRIGNC